MGIRLSEVAVKPLFLLPVLLEDDEDEVADDELSDELSSESSSGCDSPNETGWCDCTEFATGIS